LNRQSTLFYLLFKCIQLFTGGIRLFLIIWVFRQFIFNLFGFFEITEVEECMVCHIRVFKHTMENFKFCDALLFMFIQPLVIFQQLFINLFRYPTIFFTKQANEIRPAPFNLRKANR